MYSQAFSALLFSACLLPQTVAWDLKSFKSADIIDRDVAIIGGGSAGTYSAISLKDKGKSVIVIEKKDRLGGHTETYIDPTTGIPIDISVIVWHNTSIVTNYLKRFDLPYAAYGAFTDPTQESASYDCRTGKQVIVTTPSPEDTAAAFAKYAQFLQQYPRLDDGLFLPSPVPEDLVLPFGEFAKKYGIEATVQTLFRFNPGLGDILTVPTIEQIKDSGLGFLQTLQTGFITTARHNNSELYTRAQSELLSASSVLLSSEVEVAHREDGGHGIKLVVRTPAGKKLIRAKKLLITIPPKLDLLGSFDLSKQERGVFGKLINGGYYTSLVKNTGFPDSLSISNAEQNAPYNIPALPGIYGISSTPVPGLKLAFYGTPRSAKTFPLPDEVVKAAIINGIKTVQKANPDKFQQTEPEFVVYSSHAPFYLQARPEDTKNGFYNSLYALQGLRNTYWSGATWRGHDSSIIWKYTENEVLPKLLAGL